MGAFEAWRPLMLLFLGVCIPACECECDPPTKIELPTMDPEVAQAVTIEFRRVQATEPHITCVWADAATATGAGWSCTPAALEVRVQTGTPFVTYFTYQEADRRSEWSIALSGPSGSNVLTRAPRDTDPGEGYPGSCICYAYKVFVTADELRAVGATPR